MQTFTPRWVFFDIDDTLWNFSTNSLITLAKLYNNSDLIKTQFASETLFIDRYHEANALMWKLYGEGKISSQHLQVHRFLDILNEDSQDIKAAEKLNKDYLDILCRQRALVDGAVEMLESVHKKFMTGALTNGFLSTQYKKLYNTELWKYIRRMVVSEESEWRKPQREMFQYAQHCVGARAEECLMIGDNAITDIQAARAAGWQALHFDPSGNGDIAHLSQIPTLLGIK